MRKIFHRLVEVEEALKIIEEYVKLKPFGVEEVDLINACNRILAENIYSNIDLPPFDRSEMDGYAVIAEDTYEADYDSPVKLKVKGKIECGDKPEIEVERGFAVEISTGAPIPKGANAVVMVEYTKQEGEVVEIYRSTAPGEHIVYAGSDLMTGELVLRRGTLLTPREIGLLAAIGLSKVKVYRKPVAAIISTGRELISPGTPLQPYKVYDVNSYSIGAGVIECGCKPIIMGIAGDEPREIKNKILKALEISDIILISGGTSAGAGDLVYRVLSELGEPGIIVHGLKVKPGKPTVIAVVNGKLVIGLPGWPVSALMIFNLIVKPILMKLAGRKIEEAKKVKAKIAIKIRPAKGRVNLIPVSLTTDDTGRLIAYPLLHHSGAIATLNRADGYVEVAENVELIDAGEEVEVKLFSEKIEPPELTIIGSHCPALDKLIEILSQEITVKAIYVGSMAGLMAIKRGEADIAGIHLLDEETLTYNIPYLERYGINNAVLIRGYVREQGLVVGKGNPKRISGIEDLIRGDIKFINRNKGSGTRILLDHELKKLARKMGIPFEELKNKINGYNIEAKTHTSIANAVLHGRADAGLTIKAMAIMYNLEFIPIRKEHYDFLIKRESLNKHGVKIFIEKLKSKEFQNHLTKIGMQVPSNIGKIIWSGKAN